MSDTMPVGQGMADELDPEEAALFSGEGDAAPAPAPVVETPAPDAAPAPVAGQQPVTEDEPGDEVVEVENKGRFVRHAALHEERSRRKELQKRLGEYEQQVGQSRENQARLDERLRLLNEALGATGTVEQPQPGQPGQPAKVPTPEEDPFAYMRHLENKINQMGEATNAAQQRFQEQDTYGAVKQAFTADAQGYMAKQPDFADAYRHLLGSRDRELMAIGYQDPAERQRVIANEELMIVAQALQAGKSPAQLLYSLAAERGYRRAPAPQPAPAPAPAPSAVQQVQRVKLATAGNKSLGAAGGGATPVLTPESLANMSEAEFAKIYDSLGKADKKALFGG